MLRSIAGTCPGCQGLLQERTLRESANDATPEAKASVCGSCGSAWFEWFAGEVSGLARFLDAAPLHSVESRYRGGACPRDGTELVVQPYLDGGPEVERCSNCLGLFLHAENIEALRLYHERMPTKMEETIERTSFIQRFWHTFSG